MTAPTYPDYAIRSTAKRVVAAERWQKVREYLETCGRLGATASEIADALEDDPGKRRWLKEAIGWQRTTRAALLRGWRAVYFPGPTGHRICVQFTLAHALAVEESYSRCSVCGDEHRATAFCLLDQERALRGDICRECARIRRSTIRERTTSLVRGHQYKRPRRRGKLPCLACGDMPWRRPSCPRHLCSCGLAYAPEPPVVLDGARGMGSEWWVGGGR